MGIIIAILLAIVLLTVSYYFDFFRIDGLPRYVSPIFLLVKFAFALALWAIYTFYYTDRSTSDIYKFYDDACIVNHAFEQDKPAWIAMMVGTGDTVRTAPYTVQMNSWTRRYNGNVPVNENRIMIRLHAAMMVLWGSNIFANSLLFCFFSFIGCILLLRVFSPYFFVSNRYAVLICVGMPSFLFWTSGALKESLIMLGIGALLYGMVYREGSKWSRIAWGIVGLLTLILLRYFLLICLLPTIIAYILWSSHTSLRFNLIKYTIVILICGGVAVAIAPMDTKVNFPQIVFVKQKNAIGEALFSHAGSYSEVPRVQMTLKSVVAAMPIGLRNTLFKPYPVLSRNPMILLSAVENILWMLLAAIAVGYRSRGDRDWNLQIALAVSVLIYFSLIGLVSPVIGNLVRYRVLLLPWFIFLIVSNIDPAFWGKGRSYFMKGHWKSHPKE